VDRFCIVEERLLQLSNTRDTGTAPDL